MTRQPTPSNPFNLAARGSPQARRREATLERAVAKFVTQAADGSSNLGRVAWGSAKFWCDIAELAARRASDPLKYESDRLLEVMRDGVRHDRPVVAEHVAFHRLLFASAVPNLAASFDSIWTNGAAQVLNDSAAMEESLDAFGSLVATFYHGDGPRARVAMSRLLEHTHFELSL